ncbi:DUF2726 domain-containing protein, partial [Escherichia coli]
AAEPQTGRREVSALTDARKTLAYDFFRILRAPPVELDDASHLRPERRRRDILLEEVLRQAGIPLLRSHDARKLLQMTGEWLNTTGADQPSPEHRS